VHFDLLTERAGMYVTPGQDVHYPAEPILELVAPVDNSAAFF